jgi:hypothetical protein
MNFQKEKDEGKAILLPASCDAGKKNIFFYVIRIFKKRRMKEKQSYYLHLAMLVKIQLQSNNNMAFCFFAREFCYAVYQS